MSIAASHRPDPDELAAFIDGQLSGDERHKLEVHLGACEACREVVAESLLLLEDAPEERLVVERDEDDKAADVGSKGARVLTHPGWHRTAWQLAPLAAAALLAVMLWPTLTSFLYGPPDGAGFIASFADPEGFSTRLGGAWSDQEWAVYRGSYVDNLSSEQVAFRLGVRTVDLQVAFRGETQSDRKDILEELIVLLRDGLEFATALELQYQQIHDSIDAVPDEQKLESASQAERDLEQYLKESRPDFDYFLLGRWAEAGRLAAMIGDQAYFGKRSFLGPARELERAELKQEVAEQIRLIRKIGKGPEEENDLRALRQAFDKIIREAG